MGPVPVPGGPVRLGHVHPRLSLPPLERLQVDRGRRGDSALPPGDRGGLRRRPPDQLPHPRRAGRLVQPGRPLDRDGRGHQVGRSDQADLRIPVPVLRLLPLRPGLHAVLARPGRLRRHHRAPAALAGGPRPHRPAGRGHRQRRHRRHDRPGSRRHSRARDHAAALTLVRAAHPGPRPGLCPAPQGAARAPGVCGGALEEHPDRDRALRPVPQVPRSRAGGAAQGGPQAAAGRLRRGHALRPGLPALGPAHVPGP